MFFNNLKENSQKVPWASFRFQWAHRYASSRRLIASDWNSWTDCNDARRCLSSHFRILPKLCWFPPSSDFLLACAPKVSRARGTWGSNLSSFRAWWFPSTSRLLEEQDALALLRALARICKDLSTDQRNSDGRLVAHRQLEDQVKTKIAAKSEKTRNRTLLTCRS